MNESEIIEWTKATLPEAADSDLLVKEYILREVRREKELVVDNGKMITEADKDAEREGESWVNRKVSMVIRREAGSASVSSLGLVVAIVF